MAKNCYTNLWDRPGFFIRRLHQIHVAMFLEECEEFDITPVQFGVISVLYDGDSMDQRTLAKKIGADRNTTADVIRRLNRRGYLTHTVNDNDRRAKLAQITEAGKRVVEQVYPLMWKAQERFVDPLTEEEAQQFQHLLQKILLANNDAGRAELQP